MRKRKILPPPDKPVRFIACDENKQTFHWQKTNGLSSSSKYALEFASKKKN